MTITQQDTHIPTSDTANSDVDTLPYRSITVAALLLLVGLICLGVLIVTGSKIAQTIGVTTLAAATIIAMSGSRA